MRAYVIHEFGDIDRLQLESLPEPTPADNEVIIKVKAAALNPLDLHALSGDMGKSITLPAVIGSDVSGVVDQVGKAVTDFTVGDAVMGLINFPGTDGTSNGRGYAEYAPAPADQIVIKPAELSFETAAALPAVGLTAKQALEDLASILPKQRVLIHGAAGGVGHIAVQIAKQHGAHVIATASAKDADFVRSLGADKVIDYHTQKFQDLVHDVDLVFDTVGGSVAEPSVSVLVAGGTYITTVWPALSTVQELAKTKGVTTKAVSVTPNAHHLTELAHQVASGALRVNIDQVYPLDQLPAALAHQKAGGVQGKLVVTVEE